MTQPHRPRLAVTIHIDPTIEVTAMALPDAAQVAVFVGPEVTIIGPAADVARLLATAMSAVTALELVAESGDKFLDHLRSGTVTGG